MTILSDIEIEYLSYSHNMIEPFSSSQNGKGAISFGVSSYGYDLTAASAFEIFTPSNATVIDPKQFDRKAMVKAELMQDDSGIFIIAPPHSFVLAHTIEYLRMPRDITGLMTTKSTYARCGIVSPPTVLEADWEGQVTIEISNITPLPARIYAHEGIAQVLFFRADEMCKISYADRNGKYQGQEGITLAKVMR